MKTLIWKLEDIPNVGPRIAGDFRNLGIFYPKDLKGKDPLKLYKALIKKTGVRQDPCVLDVFMAAVDFVKTGKPKKWWAFTSRRKKLLTGPGRCQAPTRPLDSFAEFVADQLEGLEGFRMKRMFGGSGLYLKESFFGILSDGKLYFKTNSKTLPGYLALKSKPFEYSQKGKKTIRLKNYYEVPADILEARKELKAWAFQAANFLTPGI